MDGVLVFHFAILINIVCLIYFDNDTVYMSEFTTKADKVINHFNEELQKIHMWRAAPAMVDNIDVYVPSYDMTQKISAMGNVTLLDSQTLKIEAWDKTALSSIEKGIFDADIGLTPVNHWEFILINVPPLTQERRKEMGKHVSKLGEQTKIALRNARQDAMKKAKNDHDEDLISENEKHTIEAAVEKDMKLFTAKVDELVKAKEEDLMKI